MLDPDYKEALLWYIAGQLLWRMPLGENGQYDIPEELRPIKDSALIEEVCQTVIKAYPTQVSLVRKGKTGVLNFLLAAVLKESGQLDPEESRKVLSRLLRQET